MATISPLIIVFFIITSFGQRNEAVRQKFDRRHLAQAASESTSPDPDHGQHSGNDLSSPDHQEDHHQDQDPWSGSNVDQEPGTSKSYEESIPPMPEEVRQWLKKSKHVKRVVRRPYSYGDRRATGGYPPLPMPPHSYPYPSPSSAYPSHDSGDSSYSGVFARWNPKINWTNPYFGSSPSASSEFPNYAPNYANYPDYQTSATDYDHHIHHTPHVQYIPYPVSTCHEHHGKKKEIGYIWPLILLGLLFLPFLFGALLVPLVLVFFTNLIQLVSLIITGQQAATAAPGAAGRRRKKRDLHGTLAALHPMILEKIEEIGHQLDDSLHEFLESSWFKNHHLHRSEDHDSDYSSVD